MQCATGDWKPKNSAARRKAVASEEEEEAESVDKTRGLSPGIQKKVLLAIDKHGGLEQVSNKHRLLGDICKSDIDSFGSPHGTTPRGRRKKVANFVDKHKRLSESEKRERRSKIFLAAEDSEPSPLTATPESKSKRAKLVTKPRSALKPKALLHSFSHTAFTKKMSLSEKELEGIYPEHCKWV